MEYRSSWADEVVVFSEFKTFKSAKLCCRAAACVIFMGFEQDLKFYARETLAE